MARARAKSSKSEDAIAAAVEYFAAKSHNAWRREFHKDQPKQKHRRRMRLRGGVMVDVNKPWSKLNARAQADNRIAAYEAHKAVMRYPNNREAASAFIHRRWIARNKHDPSQPKALMRPYKELSEVEKDKDRAHFDRMKAAIAAVKKPAKKTTAKKKPKQAQKRRPTAKAASRLAAPAAAKRTKRRTKRTTKAASKAVASKRK